MNREKWFAENEWYLDAMRKGEMVEFSDFEDFSKPCNAHAGGIKFFRPAGGLFVDDDGYSWCYARPIPKKKMRPMTRDEARLKILNTPRIMIRQTARDGMDWMLINECAFSYLPKSYEYIEIPEGYKGDFSDLEVKKFEVEAAE